MTSAAIQIAAYLKEEDLYHIVDAIEEADLWSKFGLEVSVEELAE